MNPLTKSIAVLATLALAGAASADTDIFIAGSNGDRTATNTAIPKLLTGTVTFSGTNADPTKANFGVFKGGTFNGEAVTVYVAYIGATGGVKAVAGLQTVKFVAAGSTGVVTDPTVTGNPNQAHIPDFTMSTNYQNTSPYRGLYQGVQYATLDDQLIGVTGLKWLGSKNFPGDNVTSQSIEALYLGGAQPLALFTGLSADQNKTVYALGRNSDAGQRYIALAEPKVGGSSTSAINAKVKQWKPTVSGAAAGVGGFVTGGTVNAHALWPLETISGVDSEFLGNGGFPTGATLAPSLTVTLGDSVYTTENPNATAGYYLGYLTPGDSDTIAIPNGAVELKYNGVPYSADHVREGRYTSWVYSHLLYRNGLAGPQRLFADALAGQIKTVDAVAGGGILIGTMKVQRFSDGGNVTPIFF
jgi:hypothetical protein